MIFILRVRWTFMFEVWKHYSLTVSGLREQRQGKWMTRWFHMKIFFLSSKPISNHDWWWDFKRMKIRNITEGYSQNHMIFSDNYILQNLINFQLSRKEILVYKNFSWRNPTLIYFLFSQLPNQYFDKISVFKQRNIRIFLREIQEEFEFGNRWPLLSLVKLNISASGGNKASVT